MRGTRFVWALLGGLALSGCDDGGTAPTSDTPPAPPGVDFGLAADRFGSHSAKGVPSSPEKPLQGEFAVAVPDSLGGLVILSYNDATSHLFILQVASTAEDGYQCGTVSTAPPCHARFFENVREVEGVVRVDGRLDLETGGLTLIEVREDVVLATFRGQFVRTAGAGEPTFTVTDGTIDVDLLEGPLPSGGLGFLVDLAVDGLAQSAE